MLHLLGCNGRPQLLGPLTGFLKGCPRHQHRKLLTAVTTYGITAAKTGSEHVTDHS